MKDFGSFLAGEVLNHLRQTIARFGNEFKEKNVDGALLPLKQLGKKLVRIFHPDLHEHDWEKRKTYELLTQAINEARDRGDIELLERIAKDPQAFILKQG